MKKKTKFFINGIILSTVGLAMRGVGLALSAYVSRTVGAEGVGLNSLVMNVYAFAFTFATAGITLTVTALVAAAIGDGGIAREGAVLRGAFLYALGFGGTAFLILSLLAGPIASGVLGEESLSRPLFILSLSLIPSALSSVVSGYFIGRRRVVWNSALQVLGQLMRVVFTVTLLSGASGADRISSITALALGVTLTELIVFILSVLELFLARGGGGREKREPSDVGGVARVCLPIALSAYVRSALITIEHAIIPMRLFRHGDTREGALSSYGSLHGMALPLLLYPLVPLSSFGSLLLPEFAEARAKGETERMKKIASLALGRSLRYAVIISSLLFFFSEELGYVIYSSYDVGRYIAILSPVVPLMFLDHVADNMLKGIGEQVYSMWVNILDSALSVFLVFVLLPVMGIEGYALVIIAMEGFNFTLSIIRLKKKVGFKLNLLFDGAVPLLLAVLSSKITRRVFSPSGREVTFGILISELVFTLSLYIAFSKLRELLSLSKQRVEYDHSSKSEKHKVGGHTR